LKRVKESPQKIKFVITQEEEQKWKITTQAQPRPQQEYLHTMILQTKKKNKLQKKL
jgi:hypothetical protein